METTTRETRDPPAAERGFAVAASHSVGRGWRERLRSFWVRKYSHPARARRLLFLDDDLNRAEIFLQENPQGVCVTTVAECLARLGDPWEEVHLDHDLGGQTFVDSNSGDCGMEVIRCLCNKLHPHLRETRFFIHTHHMMAGLLMVLLLRRSGYHAEARPFGFDLAGLLAHDEGEGNGDDDSP